MLICFNRHKDRHAKANFCGLKQSNAPADDSFFFKFLDPPPTGGDRQADFAGNIRNRLGCIFLQKGEDFSVRLVHRYIPAELIFVKRTPPLYLHANQIHKKTPDTIGADAGFRAKNAGIKNAPDPQPEATTLPIYFHHIYNHSLICAICQPENFRPFPAGSAEGCFFVGLPEKIALKKIYG